MPLSRFFFCKFAPESKKMKLWQEDVVTQNHMPTAI